MSRLFAALLLSSAILAPVGANAFGLPGIPGMGSKSDGGSSVDLSGAQDELVAKYLVAGQHVLNGQQAMLEAVGLQDDAAKARATADTFTKGATQSALSDGNSTMSAANDKLVAAFKDTKKLEGPARAKFATGVLSLAQGMVTYVSMKNSLDSFQKGLSSASPMALMNLKSGATIVSTLPASVKNLGATISAAVSYAKSQDIAVPDAEGVMAKLQ